MTTITFGLSATASLLAAFEAKQAIKPKSQMPRTTRFVLFTLTPSVYAQRGRGWLVFVHH